MAKVQPQVGRIARENTIRREAWRVRRFARIDEIEMEDGTVRFRLVVWDVGRQPFLIQWFNDLNPINDFLDRLMEQGS